jgi:hypothetical protein
MPSIDLCIEWKPIVSKTRTKNRSEACSAPLRSGWPLEMREERAWAVVGVAAAVATAWICLLSYVPASQPAEVREIANASMRAVDASGLLGNNAATDLTASSHPTLNVYGVDDRSQQDEIVRIAREAASRAGGRTLTVRFYTANVVRDRVGSITFPGGVRLTRQEDAFNAGETRR